MRTQEEWNEHFRKTYDNSISPMDWPPGKNQQHFEDMMEMIKDMVRPYMETKEGRDQIRQTFGCRIGGYEEEEKGLPIQEWFQNKR